MVSRAQEEKISNVIDNVAKDIEGLDFNEIGYVISFLMFCLAQGGHKKEVVKILEDALNSLHLSIREGQNANNS